ncbi:phenylacetate--CoA ligase family protein [Coralliovum pocilloporae]|uniref:phenylacetate--CoA ligase family protein n=1 Tax=Coralliovum pocilloporae TaxID=3066369 RepID=UPI003306C21B
MTDHYDALETRSSDERDTDLMARLPDLIRQAIEKAEGWRSRFADVDVDELTTREALARLPVLRKTDLMQAQTENAPFGGLVTSGVEGFERIFLSPGPVWEPQARGDDQWRGARALFAAGFRPGDVVHNAFSYHMTPGGFILDTAARGLGCAVFPAGVGNTEQQIDAIAALRPTGYTGTPDYLKILLDQADEAGKDASSISKALVSGGALFPSLRAEYEERGVSTSQCYATADLGVIAYESSARDGMIVNEDFIVEIVRPGTGDLCTPGEVGELVVTNFNPVYPLIRFGTGDLTAILPGESPCGRTNTRIKGWMGRADQRTKIKGMFVDPAQVDQLVKRNPGLLKARLIVSRQGEQDAVRLKAVTDGSLQSDDLVRSFQDITKLRAEVDLISADDLPNDGKVISDERDYQV